MYRGEFNKPIKEVIEIRRRQGGKLTEAFKQLQSEHNILKQVHAKIVNDYADYKIQSYMMDCKLKDEIVKLKQNIEDIKEEFNIFLEEEGYTNEP